MEKPLPVVRSTEFMEMGYKETVEERIPLGRISFRQALKLIGDHRVNPEEWTAEKVAETYKLKVDVASESGRDSLFTFIIITAKDKCL